MSEQRSNTPPTLDQMITVLKEQIMVKELQSTLQELNTKIAKGRAEEVEAYAKAAHFTPTTTDPNVVEHIVTQQDLDNNPEMVKMNIEVGHKIGIPREAYEQFINNSPTPQKETAAPTVDREIPKMQLVQD